MPPKKAATGTTKKPAVTGAKKAPVKSQKASAKAGASAAPVAPVEEPDEDLGPCAGFSLGLKQAVNATIASPMDQRLIDSKRWPLIIDPTRRVATFLRHRDCNYLDAMDPLTDSERIRLCLIGSLRYGKPLVWDMMDNDLMNMTTEKFDSVQIGLMKWILNKSILQEEKYMQLVRESDGDEYARFQFVQPNLENFRFIMVTELEEYPVTWTHKLCPVTIS